MGKGVNFQRELTSMKVDAETGLSVLAYNIKRVINIIGLRKLIMSMKGLKIDYRQCVIEG